MPEFRKKPVTIEAHQWGMQNDWQMPDWLRAVALPPSAGVPLKIGSVMRTGENLSISTLEGIMTARPGDWVIRGVKGELYPCKPDIFAATYEAA